jgi:lipoprotein signal peptidase
MTALTLHPDNNRRLAGVVAVVVLVDQLTKLAAGIVGPLGSLIYPVRNHALSLELAHGGRWPETAAMALGLVAAVVITGPRTAPSPVRAVAAGLLIGGAASNMVDRAVFGSVHDFLVVGPIVVNVADLAVVAGLFLFALSRRTNPTAPQPKAAPSPQPERR